MKSIYKALYAISCFVLLLGLWSCQKEEVNPQKVNGILRSETQVDISFESNIVLTQGQSASDVRAIPLIGQPVGSDQYSPSLDWEGCDWDNEAHKPSLVLVVSNAYKTTPTGGVHTVYKVLESSEYTVVLSKDSPKKSPQIKVKSEVTLKPNTLPAEYFVSAFLMDKGGDFYFDDFESTGEVKFKLDPKHLDAHQGNKTAFSSLIFGLNRIPLTQAVGEDKSLAHFRPVGTALVLEVENLNVFDGKKARHLSLVTDGFTRAGTLSLDPSNATNGFVQDALSPYYSVSVEPGSSEMYYDFDGILPEVQGNDQEKNRVTFMAIPTKGKDEYYILKMHYAYDEGGQRVNTSLAPMHRKFRLQNSALYDGKSTYLKAPAGYIKEKEYFRTEWHTESTNPSISFRVGSLDATKTNIFYRKKGTTDWFSYQVKAGVDTEVVEINDLEPDTDYEIMANHLSKFLTYNRGDFRFEPRLRLVTQWGTSSKWSGDGLRFENAANLDITATDIPDLERLRSTARMFAGAINLVGNATINDWNVSNVTDMSEMFHLADKFNQPLNNWNVSNVTDMSYMFARAISFNQPLNNWNVSNVTDMSYMFTGAKKFNQPLNIWNVGQVTNMEAVFWGADSFNQPLNNWNVSNVTNMTAMFNDAGSFNQPLNNWNVSNVTHMRNMFAYTESFNQPLSNWNVSNVTDMGEMFYFATSFNQPLNNWNVSNVTDMSEMFHLADKFNQPLNNWNVSNVTNMSHMFNGATSFNQPLNNWNVSNVTNMSQMFSDAVSFNQPLDNWNVSNVTNMHWMFRYATSFNQPLNNWNVSNVTNMSNMFSYATSFNQPLNNWNVSNVTDMSLMFDGAESFNQPLDRWRLNSIRQNNRSSTAGAFEDTGMSEDNIDATLGGWIQNPDLQTDIYAPFYYDVHNRPKWADKLDWLIHNKGWKI